MRKLVFLVAIFGAFSSTIAGAGASADGVTATLNFAVTRNGEQIGSTTVRLRPDGDQTIAETTTAMR